MSSARFVRDPYTASSRFTAAAIDRAPNPPHAQLARQVHSIIADCQAARTTPRCFESQRAAHRFDGAFIVIDMSPIFGRS